MRPKDILNCRLISKTWQEKWQVAVLSAAERKDPVASHVAGWFAMHGIGGCPKDHGKAVRLYHLAAEQGHADAQYDLGCCCANGLGDLDFPETMRQFWKPSSRDYEEYSDNFSSWTGIDRPEYSKGEPLSKILRKSQRAEFPPLAAVLSWTKAANQGHAIAQFKLGESYENKNHAKSVEWYTKSAAQGYAKAQFALGRDRDDDEAVGRYLKSAEPRNDGGPFDQGYAKAQFRLGKYYDGSEHHEDHIKAVEWYRKAAVQGYDESQNPVDISNEVVDKDLIGFVKSHQKMAAQGYDWAQYALGQRYENGNGVPQDPIKAMEWYQKAAVQGCGDAQDRLDDGEFWCAVGDCYYSGKGVVQDCATAVKWWKGAVSRNNTEASLYLGCCYEHGEGVEKNDTKAVRWYQHAAMFGNPFAQYNLASCYRDGRGVAQDDLKAVEWFEKAADQGMADAQFMAGLHYHLGRGVKQNYIKAVEWYQKAAEQGNHKAQVNIGECYRNGWGVDKDPIKALEWWTKAAKQGDEYAQNNLDIHYKKDIEQEAPPCKRTRTDS